MGKSSHSLVATLLFTVGLVTPALSFWGENKKTIDGYECVLKVVAEDTGTADREGYIETQYTCEKGGKIERFFCTYFTQSYGLINKSRTECSCGGFFGSPSRVSACLN